MEKDIQKDIQMHEGVILESKFWTKYFNAKLQYGYYHRKDDVKKVANLLSNFEKVREYSEKQLILLKNKREQNGTNLDCSQ
jgi:hypothetical protein